MSTMIYDKISPREARKIINAARKAAISLAKFWDVMKSIEDAHQVSFDGTTDAIELLASECGYPIDSSCLNALCASDVLELLDIDQA